MQRTREAELDLDKELSGKFIDALSNSLQKRKKGTPMRLLYDTEMPMVMLKYLVSKMGLHGESLIPGNRYHNFKNFISFPHDGAADLKFVKYPSLPFEDVSLGKRLFGLTANKNSLGSTARRLVVEGRI